jgi:hypothetical protein
MRALLPPGKKSGLAPEMRGSSWQFRGAVARIAAVRFLAAGRCKCQKTATMGNSRIAVRSSGCHQRQIVMT